MTPEEMDKAKVELRERFKNHPQAMFLKTLSNGDVEWWVRYENGDTYKRMTRDTVADDLKELNRIIAQSFEKLGKYPHQEGD